MATSSILTNIIYFAIIAGITFFGYFYLIKYKKNLLQKKNNTGERFASQSKPIIGGTMFMVCVLLSFLYTTILSIFNGTNPDYPLLICCIIAFGMGCIDDLKNFSPLFKLIFQIICSFIFILCDSYIKTSDNIFLNYALTFFWVVGLMNSINMLDNMDGITASISIIIFIGIAMLTNGNTYDLYLLLAIIAGLAMFLIWNWHPSKMYMGDNGSQLLGILLAYFSIKYVWNSDGIKGFNYEQVIYIGLMFIVPLTDTITVAINRFLGGRSPFVGDRFHTTHCLVYKGLSIPVAVILLDAINIIGCALATYFIAVKHGYITHPQALILCGFIVLVFSIAYIMNLLIRKENNLLYNK